MQKYNHQVHLATTLDNQRATKTQKTQKAHRTTKAQKSDKTYYLRKVRQKRQVIFPLC